MEQNIKLKGFVKWFNEKKGFGFVESQGKEYFLHYSDIMMEGFKTVDKGEAVEFKVMSSPKGDKAVCVTFC